MMKSGKQVDYSGREDFNKKSLKSGFSGIGACLTTLELFMTLMDEKITKVNKDEDSVKVLVLHSQDDSDKAEELVKSLNEGRKIRAVADCQLSVFKMMSFVSYIGAAIEWSDMVVALMTDNYAQDVKNIGCSIWRSNSSLHTRHGFKLLQHKVYSDENFPAVAVVYEGMPHSCHEFPEFKCVHWKSSLSEVKEPILKLYKQVDSVKQHQPA